MAEIKWLKPDSDWGECPKCGAPIQAGEAPEIFEDEIMQIVVAEKCSKCDWLAILKPGFQLASG